MTEDSQYQSLIAKIGLISLITSLNIPAEVVGYLLISVFLDSILGVAKSWKLDHELSFNRFIWGMVGKLSILIIPFMIAYFGLAFKHDLTWIVDAFIYIIAANETIAILGKIGTLRTGRDYKSKDFVAKAIDGISFYFENKMNKILDALKK